MINSVKESKNEQSELTLKADSLSRVTIDRYKDARSWQLTSGVAFSKHKDVIWLAGKTLPMQGLATLTYTDMKLEGLSRPVDLAMILPIEHVQHVGLINICCGAFNVPFELVYKNAQGAHVNPLNDNQLQIDAKPGCCTLPIGGADLINSALRFSRLFPEYQTFSNLTLPKILQDRTLRILDSLIND